MKKLLIIGFVLIMGCLLTTNNNIVNAQVLDGVYVKEHVPSRKPIPYTHLREADVMYSKRLWRMIDLREKINHPLYFPTQPIGDRRSLIDLLLWGITNEGLTAYDAKLDDRFKIPMGKTQIDEAFGVKDQVVSYPDPVTGEMIEQVVEGSKDPTQVKQYLMKEDWFFNKQTSRLEVRIIGLCPIRHFYREEDLEQLDVQRSSVFWIYFPEARRILANNEVYNPYNDAERKTYDDIFFKRRFSSYVFQESNVYNNRGIGDYQLGIEALLEAEKVKEEVFRFEHDLWEY